MATQRTKGATIEMLTSPGRFGVFVMFMVLLSLCFLKPLLDLMRFATKSSLYSHVLLVPVISLYLVWLRRMSLPRAPGRTSVALTAVIFLLGVVSLAAY